MDPQDAFLRFAEITGSHDSPLAFFVGYAYGAAASRESIERLLEAYKETQTKDGDGV